METVSEVDVARARELLDEGAYLLDVRNPDEWEAGHAPGAVHVAMNTLQERLGELPADRTAVVICKSGGRSWQVTRFLSANGYGAVNVVGGMDAWAAQGLPLVSESAAPPRVA